MSKQYIKRPYDMWPNLVISVGNCPTFVGVVTPAVISFMRQNRFIGSQPHNGNMNYTFTSSQCIKKPVAAPVIPIPVVKKNPFKLVSKSLTEESPKA